MGRFSVIPCRLRFGLPDTDAISLGYRFDGHVIFRIAPERPSHAFADKRLAQVATACPAFRDHPPVAVILDGLAGERNICGKLAHPDSCSPAAGPVSAIRPIAELPLLGRVDPMDADGVAIDPQRVAIDNACAAGYQHILAGCSGGRTRNMRFDINAGGNAERQPSSHSP